MGISCIHALLGGTISFHQKPKQGDKIATSDYKRLVESYVAIVYKSRGILIFGIRLYEPFLTSAGQTIAAYVVMTED